MQLKKLEVERDRVEKWDGRYPTYLMQMAGVGKAPDLNPSGTQATPARHRRTDG